MRIKSSIMIGVLVSVMTLCAAFADSVVTSKSYVDAQDALKQNKIPVSGTNHGELGNSIITYTNAAGRIGERELITDPDMLYDMQDGHIEAGLGEIPTVGAVGPILQALWTSVREVETNLGPVIDPLNTVFQTKIPALSGVVTYNDVDAYGQSQFGQLDVYWPDPANPYNAGTDADKLATMGAVMASMAASGSQPALSGTNGAIVTYGNAPGVTGERKILSEWYQPFVPGLTAGNGDHLVDAQSVMGVVYTIGNRPISVMECADGENVSDEDCMLWHISQRHVLSWPTNAGYQRSPFINSSEFPSYEPYNP